jgi:catechol 2,3-dioxygenase
MCGILPVMAPPLPANLRLGPVHLRVRDLDRSVPFYERSIGLRLQRREDGNATLGSGAEDLLTLHEDAAARPAGRHAGLYHFALLHPSRRELARAAKRLIETRTPISGASDHGVSEAIYLSDPDGNGIELAADRPRERWGDLRDPTALGGPEPLDMQSLMSLVDSEEPPAQADDSLVVGHLHLHVGDLQRALAFYRDVIGFQVMTLLPSAAFISAGGYHHHLGLNTWRGEGVPAAPSDAVGLVRWTVLLGDESELAVVRERIEAAGIGHEDREGGLLVRDPFGNALLLAADELVKASS